MSEAGQAHVGGSEPGTRPAPLRGAFFAFSRSVQPTLHSDGWVIPEPVRAALDVRVDVLDLTPRSANVLANLRIRSVRQLLREPKTKLLRSPRFGAQSLAEVERKVDQYLAGRWPPPLAGQKGKKRGKAGSPLAPKAVVDGMLSILPEREQSILAARYGLWDGKTQTLANIANQHGVTRERVRQIEARELCRLGRVFSSSRGKGLLGKKFKEVSNQKFKRRLSLELKDGLTGAMANDCTPQEAALAIQFCKKVWWGGKQKSARRRPDGSRMSMATKEGRGQ